MNQATLGRIVHYKTRGSADGVFPPQNFAAIVTDAHNGITVDLVTFGPSGLRFERGVGYGENPGQWHWPSIVSETVTTQGSNSVTVPYTPYVPATPTYILQAQNERFPGQPIEVYNNTQGSTAGTTDNSQQVL